MIIEGKIVVIKQRIDEISYLLKTYELNESSMLDSLFEELEEIESDLDLLSESHNTPVEKEQ